MNGPRNTQVDSPEVAALQAELTHLEEQIGRLYRQRDPILAKLAELRGEYELPPPSKRTAVQTAISRCPRCRGKIEV